MSIDTVLIKVPWFTKISKESKMAQKIMTMNSVGKSGFDYGLFGGGHTGSSTDYTDKYTYSNNMVTPGTVLG